MWMIPGGDLCLFKSQGLLALKSQSSFSHLYSVLSGRSDFTIHGGHLLHALSDSPEYSSMVLLVMTVQDAEMVTTLSQESH